MSAGNATTTPYYTSRNIVTLVQGGASYFSALLHLIESATSSVHLQTYIFEADETGRLVGEALQQAAARGIKIYVLLDGYASQRLDAPFIEQLKNNKIQLRWFEPLLRSKTFYFGRRLHHKIVVADGIRALVGGVNISDRSNDLPGQPAWLDWAVQVEGEAADQLYKLCISFWNKSAFRLNSTSLKYTPSPAIKLPEHECLVRVRRNDWVRGKVEISRSYIEMLRRAEKEIIIMSSYFLPGRMFRTVLAKTIRRGVDIKIIIAGRSDVRLAKSAERYWYPWLLKQKIKIYEYEPRILHGKLSVYDEKWVTVGSYNINNISAYASIELNLDILNPGFGQQTTAELKRIIKEDCTEITAEQFERKNNALAKMWYWFSYEFYRAVVFLFTFYFRQRKHE